MRDEVVFLLTKQDFLSKIFEVYLGKASQKKRASMKIELPTFANKYCVLMTACGELRDTKAGTTRGLREEEAKVARYRTVSGMAFVRVWLAGKPVRHLHVDCALRKCFPEEKMPKATHKKSEVLDVIESVLGRQIEVSIRGSFDVPLVTLPETGLIRSLAGEQASTGMSVKLVGCELSVTGAPVSKIGWNISEGKSKKTVHVRMRGRISTVVSESYLMESWEWINKQLGLFVLGRREDERT